MRVSRTGIQTYKRSEVGLDGDGLVKVYRPPEEVFDDESIRSYAHRPLTNDHPPVLVNKENWKKYAVGQIGDKVGRETIKSGDFIRVDMIAMDKAAIDDIKNGKRELSMGYNCDIDHTAGTTPEGESYDAVQRNLRMNHLAIVSQARGGSKLKIGDNHQPQNKETVMSDQTNLVLDGMTFSLPTKDAANVKALFDKQTQAIDKLKNDLKAAKDKAEKDEDEMEKLKGEKVALEASAKDNALTDAKIQAFVEARDRKANVAKIVGDKAVAEMSDVAIQAAYDTFKSNGQFDGLSLATVDGIKTTTTDSAATSYNTMVNDAENAWKTPANGGA